MRSIKELAVKGKRVFLRVDFNVPLDDQGKIRDDTRIKASLPTIRYLLEHGAKLIIASHLGRPKGKFDPAMSLKPVSLRLSELVPNMVIQAPDVVGAPVAKAKKELKTGEILVLENVRFNKAETENDETFARQLAEDIDIYVNDAFGSCHRAHASVSAIARFVKIKAAGFLLKKEVDYLRRAVRSPAKPYAAILGGAKVEDKIPVIENLLNKADHILIGGAMAYTFLKAQGKDVGRSQVEEDKKEIALDILRKASEKGVHFLLPRDHVLASKAEAGAVVRIVESFPFPPDMAGVDIGPRTVESFGKIIAGAKTIVWNGPLGIYEIDDFAHGTIEIAKAIAASGAMSIVGGGDSIAALVKSGVEDRISHISTGGGATLEFLAHETLPGLEALEE